MTNDFIESEEFRRDRLVKKIERAVEQMTVKELEAVAYDLFTKGYLKDY